MELPGDEEFLQDGEKTGAEEVEGGGPGGQPEEKAGCVEEDVLLQDGAEGLRMGYLGLSFPRVVQRAEGPVPGGELGTEGGDHGVPEAQLPQAD